MVGFRTPAGILSTLQTFRTIEIPRLVRGKGAWEPGVCLSWGKRFLGFLTEVVGEASASGNVAILSSLGSPSRSAEVEKKPDTDENESQSRAKDTEKTNDERKETERTNEPTVWRVSFTPQQGVSVRVLDEEEVDDVRGGEDRVGFLPRWFWEEMRLDINQENMGHIQTQSGVGKRDGIPPGWQI